MTTKVCAVRDRAMDQYGQPIFTPTIGTAVRAFQDEINNEQSSMHKHADDYDLYHIGDYEADTGQLIPVQPKMIAVGKEMLNQPQ